MTSIGAHESAIKQDIFAFQAGQTAPAASTSTHPHLTFAAAWPAARDALMLLMSLVPVSYRFIVSIVTSVGDTLAATSGAISGVISPPAAN